MAEDFTTTELIESIKQAAMIPTSQETFTNARFLRFLNEKMRNEMVPLVMSSQEEYFVHAKTISMTTDEDEYNIPQRAIGNKLRDIYLLNGTSRRFMERFMIEDIPLRDGSSAFFYNRPAFYLRDNKIVIVYSPITTNDSLVVHYYRRPNTLVLTTACSKVESVNTTTGVVTVDDVPSTFVADVEIDFIEGRSPFKSLDDDVSITSVDSDNNTITFDADDLPSGLQANDYICIAGESPIAQIPLELFSVLTHVVAISCLQSMGDIQGVERLERDYKNLKRDAVDLITDRVEGKPRKIKNSFSALKSTRGWRTWRNY